MRGKTEASVSGGMVIEESVLINAGIDKVWKTFTDLTCWNEWNTVMGNLSSNENCLSNGAAISCCFRPFLFPVKANIRVEEVIPCKHIIWYAKKRGFLARNEFSFLNHGKGTLVTSRETFNGFFVSALGCFLPKKRMKNLITTFLKDLKTASENHLSK